MYKIKSNLEQTANINGIEFAGYASVFNVIDKHKDVIEKGAFSGVDISKVELLFKHNSDYKVGTIAMLKQDDYGLYVEGFIDEALPKSDELISAIQNGSILHFSIGYYTKKNEKKGGINYISDIDLVEISFVDVPANKDAKILNVDGIYTDSKIKKLINDVKMFFCDKN